MHRKGFDSGTVEETLLSSCRRPPLHSYVIDCKVLLEISAWRKRSSECLLVDRAIGVQRGQ